MKLHLDYDREIDIENRDDIVTFTYYQFNIETFKQSFYKEEALLFASTITKVIQQDNSINPIKKLP